MTALQLFKNAGALDDILGSVKNEWENGDYLKPMAVGAGAGGLGFGAGALLGKGEEGESGSDKTKRVLSQMLKGTALGGMAGGAYGGIKHLSRDFISNDGKDSTTSKEDPQSDKKLTADKGTEAPKGLPKNYDELKTENPVKTVGAFSGLGGLAGGATGYSVGGLAEKALPNRLAAAEASPKLRDFNAVKEMVQPGSGKGYGVLKDLVSKSQGGVNLLDLAPHLGGGHSSQAAASIAQQLAQSMSSQAGSHVPYVNQVNPGDALDLAKAISANPADPALAKLVENPGSTGLLKKLMGGASAGPVGFDDLSVIRDGENFLKGARKPLAVKGGLLGLLGGAGYGAYKGLSGPEKPELPSGEAPKLPDNKQINMGNWSGNPTWSLGLGGK